MKKTIFFAAALILAGSAVRAAIVHKTVEYKQDGTTFEGIFVYDNDFKEKRPAVIVVPDWKGVGPNSRMRAEKLAQLGYVALTADVYGKGVRPQTDDEAAKVSGELKGNRTLLRAR